MKILAIIILCFTLIKLIGSFPNARKQDTASHATLYGVFALSECTILAILALHVLGVF